MSFINNLENTLKGLEERQERDPGQTRRAAEQRHSEGERARAAQPWAERLRKGPFAQQLMTEATRIGFGLRTKVYISWAGSALRLDARERRLELRPTPDGVIADSYVNGERTGSWSVDLNSDARKLAEIWLTPGGAQRPEQA
ncbi:MAG TPA: hypothetical protein VFA28_14030 [Bryobacteraceae bacterium]|jgi:hypothetical protein|nr:hypothetical protein [Bryobacteraceae bacterium]